MLQNRLWTIHSPNFRTLTSKLCIDSTQNAEKHTHPNGYRPINEHESKTITEKFTNSMEKVEADRVKNPIKKIKEKIGTSKLLKPIDSSYTSRFQYNGYLKAKRWQYYNDDRLGMYSPETEDQYNYRLLKKHKFAILMGFAGGNYFGMQYNKGVHTIEDVLLEAMLKNRWILSEHIQKPWSVDFQRGSRTDRGVSAARQIVSLILRKYTFCASLYDFH